MKFLTAILVLLFALNLYPQADVTVNLFIHTADYSGSETIFLGIDSTATDGVDPWLGESNLPPDFCAPWGTGFCAFLRLPPFDGTIVSYRDFRFGEVPFTGQVTHKIEVVNYGSTGNDSIYIRYDLPEGVNINFIDELGGVLTNFTIEDSGEIAYLYISQLRSLWMYVNYNNVIPVEITAFNGRITDGNNVELNWSTAAETNNSGFQIERRKTIDGKNEVWIAVGFVSGNGTTTEPQSYEFVDKNVVAAKYNYRLKQIDYDGTFAYSNEIEVEVDIPPKEFVLHQNYPNPFNPTTKIKYEIPQTETENPLSGGARGGLVTLKVYDILGNEVATLVNEDKLAGSYEVEFNSAGLASGIYLYKLKTGNYITTKKLTILK